MAGAPGAAPDTDAAIASQVEHRVRSALAWQVFSRGVPMLVAGDEFGRTQNGNNNPYNVDAPGTWNNYNMIATDSPNAVATGVTMAQSSFARRWRTPCAMASGSISTSGFSTSNNSASASRAKARLLPAP